MSVVVSAVNLGTTAVKDGPAARQALHCLMFEMPIIYGFSFRDLFNLAVDDQIQTIISLMDQKLFFILIMNASNYSSKNQR